MKFLINTLAVVSILILSGCASIVNEAMVPISLSFSDGSSGYCTLENKRGSWRTELPGVVYVRRSDDVLKYRATTDDGREATGSIASRIGAEIVASAVFLDLGIVDSITDKHRYYPDSFVIPVVKAN